MTVGLYFLFATATYLAILGVWLEEGKLTDKIAIGVALVFGAVLALLWPLSLATLVIFKLIK